MDAFESALRNSGSDLMELLAPGLTDAESDDWVVVFRHREHIVATWGPQDESEAWRCDPYGNLRISGSLAQTFEDHAVAVRAGWRGWSRSVSARSFDDDAVPRTSTVRWM